MVYLQIFVFILVNAPKVIAAIQELIAIWRGEGATGKYAAMACLADLKSAKRRMPMTADKYEVYGNVLHMHLAKCGARK